MSESNALRDEVERAVLAEAARVGVAALDKAAIYKRFEDRGASRATIYRYIDRPLKAKAPEELHVRAVKAAVELRAAEPDPPAATAAAALPALPATVRVGDIAGAGPIPVMERLMACLATADLLVTHAKNPDGTVRSAKLLVTASEHMRRTIDTAARLQQQLRQEDELDRFHAEILQVIEAVARQYPEAGEAIVAGLNQLSARLGIA